MRCNEAVFSTLLHDEINVDEAKGGQLVPLKDFTIKNDYFSDHFSKDYYVTSKHIYLEEAHLFSLVSGLKLELQLLCETMSFVFTCKCVVWGCGCTSVAVIGN